MSAETAIPEGLAAVAQSVVTVLASVQSAAGADVARHAAELMIRLATQHLLTGCGPSAARTALRRVWADLQVEIESLNAGSAAIK